MKAEQPRGPQPRIWALMPRDEYEAILQYCRENNIQRSRFARRAVHDFAVRLGIVKPKP